MFHVERSVTLKDIRNVSRETVSHPLQPTQPTNPLVNAIINEGRQLRQHCRPSLAPVRRWFAHQTDTIVGKQDVYEPCRNRDVGEAAGGHDIKSLRQIVSHLRYVDVQYLHDAAQSQRGDSTTQQIGSRRSSFDHRHDDVRTAPGDHQRRQSPTRPQINERPPACWNKFDKPIGVSNSINQRPLTDCAMRLDHRQGGKQGGVVSHCPA